MACLAEITGLLCHVATPQGMEQGCSSWSSSKTPCFGVHRGGFGVHEEQSKVEHRDRQEEGARLLSLSAALGVPPRWDSMPNSATHSSPLSPLQRRACAPIRALMGELKTGVLSPWGALHPRRWQHIPGTAKAGKTHSCVRGLGLGVTGSEFRQCRTSLPRFLCLLGKTLLLPEPHAFPKSTVPSIADDLLGKKPHFSLIILEAQNGLWRGVTLIAEEFSVCKCEL